MWGYLLPFVCSATEHFFTGVQTDILPTVTSEHNISMRTRYQLSDSRLFNDAEALTTSLQLHSTFFIGQDEQWKVHINPNVVHAFIDNYNSVTVTTDTVPIPDPDSVDVIQGYINFDALNGFSVTLGRQDLNFDNGRMVGNVNFWQKPQSFDALKIQYDNVENLNIQYVYSNKVHRIYGHKATRQLSLNDVRVSNLNQRPVYELGEHKLNSHLFNLHYQTEDNLNVSFYHYHLENEDHKAWSNKTTGLRIVDEFKPNKFKYRYTIEHALQEDIANNPLNYQAWYSLLMLGVQYKSHRLDIAQEIRSKDNNTGFFTALGSNVNFQGWSNGINTFGIRDKFITYKGRLKRLRWQMVYHYFDTYHGSENVGREFDIELAYRLNQWDIKATYANFNSNKSQSDFFSTNDDLNVYFLTLTYNM
jgi:hypothetical protein